MRPLFTPSGIRGPLSDSDLVDSSPNQVDDANLSIVDSVNPSSAPSGAFDEMVDFREPDRIAALADTATFVTVALPCLRFCHQNLPYQAASSLRI